MNVTENVLKVENQNLNKGENYHQKITAEQGKYDEEQKRGRITENNLANINLQTDNLMEEILQRDNLNLAYKRVKKNKGAGGIDKMQVDELLPYLKENKDELIQKIREGKYKPNPVRRVEIPKEEGKKRELGIPTVVDRVFQQAIAQKLTPIYEKQFSENSYGFRPTKRATEAVKKSKEIANEGYEYVVDLDLEKFFDKVNHSKLIEILSRTIKDGKVISLINKYLNAGVLKDGLYERTEEGVPQGGPLSPILSNIMLNELDKELERRKHKYVRYADDCMILCKSRRSAERTLESISKFIENKLQLKVNKEKTQVEKINRVKYLGYSYYKTKGEYRLRIHPKTEKKLKDKIRKIMARNSGISYENRRKKLSQLIKGWVQYYKYADIKSKLKGIDEWLRRKIRAVYWKSWKKIKTRYKALQKLGLKEEWRIHELANCRKGVWRAALMLNSALTNKKLVEIGWETFNDYYMQASVN